MADKKTVLTYNGKVKLEEELEILKTVRRKDVAQKIKEARAQGDLSENAEYDAAKEEQGEIETRIMDIEKLFRNAEIIDEDGIELDKINVGCKVKLYDEEFKEEVEYSIVGSTEADPINGKLSNESPVGAALIGAMVKDTVQVETPAGIVAYKVLDIYR